MVRFRVLSYNVRSLRDDTSAIAEIIRDVDPDVVCLQEAPKYVRWRGKIAAFARRTELLYVAGGRTTGGAAMLTSLRVGVTEAQEHRLRRTPGLTRRGFVVATVTKGGARLGVASIHLGLDPAERARHLTEITGLLNRHGTQSSVEALVVAGDLNERPEAPTWSRLATMFVDAGAEDSTPTFSAAKPRRRIDAIFVRGPVEVLSYQVLDTPLVAIASDHRPVVADLHVSVDA